MLGIETEALIFLYAGLSGITVTAVYGILVLLRRLIPHKGWIISLEDFIFWLCVSVYLFHRMYRTTYGAIRWFFLLGAGAGSLTAFLFIWLAKKIWTKHKKHLEKYKKNR